jgi:hypothetical protein
MFGLEEAVACAADDNACIDAFNAQQALLCDERIKQSATTMAKIKIMDHGHEKEVENTSPYRLPNLETTE